jgi:hypothetical protein
MVKILSAQIYRACEINLFTVQKNGLRFQRIFGPDWKVWKLLGRNFENCSAEISKIACPISWLHDTNFPHTL